MQFADQPFSLQQKQKLLRENLEKFIGIDQFRDPANIIAHYHTTDREIIEQTNGKLDIIVVGIGTAGTGVGTSMKVKQYNPQIKIVGITPELGFAIQGLRNPNEPYPTQLYQPEKFDEIVELPKNLMAKILDVARRTAKEEGLLVGIRSAAIIYVSLQKANTLGKGKRIVAILPDSGLKYLSTDLFGN
jgi:cysteine synthase